MSRDRCINWLEPTNHLLRNDCDLVHNHLYYQILVLISFSPSKLRIFPTFHIIPLAPPEIYIICVYIYPYMIRFKYSLCSVTVFTNLISFFEDIDKFFSMRPIPPCHERNAFARSACSSGTSDSMDVFFYVSWEVIIQHMSEMRETFLTKLFGTYITMIF